MEGKIINHYKTIKAKELEDLDAEVTEHLTEEWGFQPYGFPFKFSYGVEGEYICQTMVRFGEPRTRKDLHSGDEG